VFNQIVFLTDKKSESATSRHKQNKGVNANLKQKSETTVNITDVLQNRRQKLHDGCKKVKDDVIRNRETKFFFSEERKAVACKTPKTGSSFLGAVFLALNTEKEMEGIFRKNRNGIHNAAHTMGIDGLKTKGLDGEDTLSIMVARDPFQRLFSVYIDKVFLLGRIGRSVERFVGNKETKNVSATCGYDVSFQDYLDNVLPRALEGSSMNPHWTPVSKTCNPCKLRYDIICKTETLTRDTEYVLDRLNLSESKRQSLKSMFHSKGIRHTVYSLVTAYMSDYRVYQVDCPNVMLLMEKIWKVFQIQGYLHNSIPFPRKEFNDLKIKEDQNITDLIIQGIESRPLSGKEKYAQRRQAIVDGYQNIKPETIESIRRVYQQDFLLFGYDLNPPRS